MAFYQPSSTIIHALKCGYPLKPALRLPVPCYECSAAAVPPEYSSVLKPLKIFGGGGVF
jgi:hypothetical protein